MAKKLFADYVKEKKLREPKETKELAQTLKTFYVESRKKGFVQCIKQLLDSVFFFFLIIKVSVRVTSLSLRLRLITPTSTLIILDIRKTSSNNCLLFLSTIDSIFSTVKPLLSGHLRDLPKCPLNRVNGGCPLNGRCKNCAMFVNDQHSTITLYCDKVACCQRSYLEFKFITFHYQR